MAFAQIGPIAVHYPSRVETNAQLAAEHPQWNIEEIAAKTGVEQRYIAAPDETSADLAVAAAEKLFREFGIDRSQCDFVLLCTQSPDYPLPTTACLIQQRLGLPNSVGAFDFNLGCSGFVYGLSMAEGLIRSGQARNVLLLTAETYSKYIDPADRSLRTIFGDAAAATWIVASEQQSLGGFQFGTDGSGADTLLVAEGGARPLKDAIQPRGRKRWASRLYMDGASLMTFTVDAIPQLVDQVLRSAGRTLEDIDWLLFHQATSKMLKLLQEKMEVDDRRLPIRLQSMGNTVSSTLPILIRQLRQSGELKEGMESLLIGFGVGWSWAGCWWKEAGAWNRSQENA
ncbi:MAG: ketoacyl-ACP synthase III [Pirellulaceae bacterium]